MLSVSECLTGFIDADLQNLGALGPASLCCDYPIVKDQLHYFQDRCKDAGLHRAVTQ